MVVVVVIAVVVVVLGELVGGQVGRCVSWAGDVGEDGDG